MLAPHSLQKYIDKSYIFSEINSYYCKKNKEYTWRKKYDRHELIVLDNK